MRTTALNRHRGVVRLLFAAAVITTAAAWRPIDPGSPPAPPNAFAAPIAASASVDTRPPSCDVVQEPVQIEYRTFNPAQPPEDLRKNLGLEAAMCEAEFKVQCSLRTTTPAETTRALSATITNVEITTQLHVTLWTPLNGPKAYLDHEETHRAIAEYYYANAAAIAKRLGTPMVGAKLPLPSGYSKAAVYDAIGQKRAAFDRQYVRETHARCSYAQDRFDAINDHGRVGIPNALAMKQAIADEEKHWRSSAEAR